MPLKDHKIWLWFIIVSECLCLLTEVFCLFIFNILANIFDFKFTIFQYVSYLLHSLHVFFSFLAFFWIEYFFFLDWLFLSLHFITLFIWKFYTFYFAFMVILEIIIQILDLSNFKGTWYFSCLLDNKRNLEHLKVL